MGGCCWSRGVTWRSSALRDVGPGQAERRLQAPGAGLGARNVTARGQSKAASRGRGVGGSGREESAREAACATSLAKSPAGLPRAERERETPARRGPSGLLAAPAAQAPCSPRQAAKARPTAPAAKPAPALRGKDFAVASVSQSKAGNFKKES